MNQRNKTIILKFNFLFPISVKSIKENWGSKNKIRKKRRNNKDVEEETAVLMFPMISMLLLPLCVLKCTFSYLPHFPPTHSCHLLFLAPSVSDLIQQQMGRIVSKECRGTKNVPSRPAELLV